MIKLTKEQVYELTGQWLDFEYAEVWGIAVKCVINKDLVAYPKIKFIQETFKF